MLHNIKYQQGLVAHERHRTMKKGLTVTCEEIAYFIDHAMTMIIWFLQTSGTSLMLVLTVKKSGIGLTSTIVMACTV
nr:MAG TPA: hypothetical protein [Bacteriophage sp.]